MIYYNILNVRMYVKVPFKIFVKWVLFKALDQREF